MVDIHYFIFIMNVDSAIASAIAGVVVFALTYVGLKLIYRMWRRNLKCPHCGDTVSTLKAVRLLRDQVNFTSTLPRRGRVVACPNCQAILPAELTNL